MAKNLERGPWEDFDLYALALAYALPAAKCGRLYLRTYTGVQVKVVTFVLSTSMVPHNPCWPLIPTSTASF
jgi:hypothetical protein